MKTNNLVESLGEFHIRAAAYKKPPVSKDVFAISIQPKEDTGVITINQGTAEVEIFGDKTLRQASISVKENGRSVTRFVSTWIMSFSKPTKKEALSRLKVRFPVVMPSKSRWSVEELKLKRGSIKNPSNQQEVRWSVSGKVTATVTRRTVNNFLVGMDETHYFISPLARKATSVAAAHRLLRPLGLRRGSLRQGEWFFESCTAATVKVLDKIASTKAHRIHALQLGKTTHTAQSAIQLQRSKKKITFARGFITDNRSYHHRALFLTSWCRVVRNREAKMKVAREQRKMAARATATFD